MIFATKLSQFLDYIVLYIRNERLFQIVFSHCGRLNLLRFVVAASKCQNFWFLCFYFLVCSLLGRNCNWPFVGYSMVHSLGRTLRSSDIWLNNSADI